MSYHPRAQTTKNWFCQLMSYPCSTLPTHPFKPVAFHPDTPLLVVTLKTLKTKHVQEYSQAPIKIRLQTFAVIQTAVNSAAASEQKTNSFVKKVYLEVYSELEHLLSVAHKNDGHPIIYCTVLLSGCTVTKNIHKDHKVCGACGCSMRVDHAPLFSSALLPSSQISVTGPV